MPGLERLLVDWGAQLRCCGGEAAPAGSLLAAAHGSNNAHAAIRSVDPNLHRCTELLISDSVLGRKWFKGECAPHRLSEKR
jgi:hypothetical protein